MQSPDFRTEAIPGGIRLSLFGDWTAVTMGAAAERLTQALKGRRILGLDLNALGRFDTAAALVLLRAAPEGVPADETGLHPEFGRILSMVAAAELRTRDRPRRRTGLVLLLEKIGAGVLNAADEMFLTFAFGGRLITALTRTVLDPRRIRWPAWFDLSDRAGMDALPIVCVTTFFIGAVVAFLGADLLTQFGAQVFAVELIGVAVLREFAVVITAVLLAGRSASAFAAELGAMRMNQEVDAMQVMGVEPFEALVIPRLMALLLTTPLLVFAADLAGLAGGGLVTWWKLDLGPAFFLQRIQENVGVKHFWVGISKAPVFAMTVAAIGCRQGLAVEGDVESLGRRVTSAVVQAIFAIIAIDAVFALIYLEANV